MRHAVCRCAVVGKPPHFCSLFDPGIIVTVAVENDPLVILDGLADHIMQSGLKIFCLLQSVRIDAQALGYCGIEHNVGAGNTVGRPQHTELELVARKSKGRSAVSVRCVYSEFGQYINAQLHNLLFSSCIRGIAVDCLQNRIQLIAQENGNDSRRCLVSTQTVVVARSGNRDSQQILIIIHGLDDRTEEKEELGILIGGVARRKQVLSAVGGYGPVIVLAASVHPCKRLLMQETNQTVLCSNLLHDLHGQLVVVCGHIGRCIDGCQLMLGRSHFIVLCLGQNSQLPELVIEILHESGNARLDHAKIVIIHFLALGRSGAKKSTAGKAQIRSLLVHFPGNQEIFLLRANRRNHPLCIIISKQTQNPQSLLAEHFHGPEKGRLLVQSMSAVRAERRRNAEGLSFDKSIGSRIPCSVASGLKGCTQAAGWEGGGIRLALDQLFARKFHDHASVRGRSDKTVMLFRSDTGQRLEPVSKMCRAFSDRPVLHRLRHSIGHTDVQFRSLIDRMTKRRIYICRKGCSHHAVIKHLTSEIIRYSTHLHFSFSFLDNPPVRNVLHSSLWAAREALPLGRPQYHIRKALPVIKLSSELYVYGTRGDAPINKKGKGAFCPKTKDVFAFDAAIILLFPKIVKLFFEFSQNIV